LLGCALVGAPLALAARAAQDPPRENAGQEPVPEEEEPISFPPAPVLPTLAPWVAPSAEEWSQRLARDARIGFTARSAVDAQREIDRPLGTADRRAVALFALGASGDPAHRQRLDSWVQDGTPEERAAAVLGLGELGASGTDRIGHVEELLLLRTVEDPDTSLAACALLALLRAGRQSGEDMAERISNDPSDRLHDEAPALVTFRLDPNGSRPTESADRLLVLRWEAAKRFGTVDGQAWSVTLLDELSNDEDFVDQVVLLSAAELEHPGVEDHLLELLLTDPSSAVLRAAVRRMPTKLDAMIGSGLWAPPTNAAWKVVIDEAVEAHNSALMPKTFQRALIDPAIAATAAGELVSQSAEFGKTILASLRSQDPDVRIRACAAASRAELDEAKSPLTALESDPDIGVRIAALVARASLREERATYFVQKILEDSSNELRPLLFDRLVRSYQLPNVITLLDQLRLRASGTERAILVACLFLRGRASGLTELRGAFPLIDPDSFGGLLVVRALGHYPTGEDLEFLARQFPLEGHTEANVEIAVALARGGHYAVRSLFQSAIWRGPWNRSVLAAGVVHARTGVRLLALWIERPPAEATSEDIRRVGFAVGQWGGLGGLDSLLQYLGNRTDHPALQGALLGALLSQTY
jgi:hypothetical protein